MIEENNISIHQLDKLSREEIVSRLHQIRSEYPHAFVEGQFKKVDDDREKSLVAIEEKFLPPKTHYQRIENRVSNGMCDTFLCHDGKSVFVELKTTKKQPCFTAKITNCLEYVPLLLQKGCLFS